MNKFIRKLREIRWQLKYRVWVFIRYRIFRITKCILCGKWFYSKEKNLHNGTGFCPICFEKACKDYAGEQYIQYPAEAEKGNNMEITEKEQKTLIKMWQVAGWNDPDYEMGDGTQIIKKHWFRTLKKLVKRIDKIHNNPTEKL